MRLSELLKRAGLTLCTKYCGITLLGRIDVPEGWISLLHPSKQGILKVPWEMPFWTAQKEHSYDGNCGWDQCWKLQQDLLLPCLFPSPSQNLFPLSMFCEHLFSLSSGGVTTYGITKKINPEFICSSFSPLHSTSPSLGVAQHKINLTALLPCKHFHLLPTQMLSQVGLCKATKSTK